MSPTAAKKPHAVCVPFPAQGHVNPMMQLAKLLHSRGFHITFVNTQFNHRRLIRSRGPDFAKGLPGFSFETIPDGLQPSDRDATQDVPALCDSTRKNCIGPFKELLLKLKSSPEVPQVTCIISDGIMTFGIKAAEDLGIPQVELWTASACSFMGYLQFDELSKRGILPFKVGAKKLHAVCVPFPAQGHVNPMMQLAKLLHSRGFHITFVNTEFNHRRLIRSRGPDFAKGLPGFSFETIPDGLPPSDRDATQDVPALCDSTRKNCIGPFKEMLLKLKSSPEVPQVTCIISDGTMTFGIKAAEDLGIPQVELWTASACSFMGYLQFDELSKRGILPFKDGNFMHDGTLDTSLDWIPGMKNIRLKDLPSFIRTQSLDDTMFDFLGSQAQNCLKSSAIIFNTFHEFEHEVLEAISANYPNIYKIGPLPLLSRHLPESPVKELGSNLWKEDSTCLQWLDKREPNSVVYVNYGSITVMTEENLREFAWGLAKSKHYFLWILRSDMVMGSDSAALPAEFYEEIKDRGLLARWCPQQEVLAHPSVGVFLTHCGWNSTVETVSAGVPVICWPFFADQQTNCRFACTTWGIGMEVNHDVKREEVADLVKEMMEGAKGKKLREKALEWKKKAVEATSVKGSSYNDFDKLIKEGLGYDG